MPNQSKSIPVGSTTHIIYSLVKFGQRMHLEELQRTGSLRMLRLAAFQQMEDDVCRGDPNEGLALLYQPDRVVVTFAGSTIKDLAAPIKVSFHADAEHHVSCFHAVTSHRLPAIFENNAPTIASENFGLGEYALVITNVTEFINRLTAAAHRTEVSLQAGLVEYIDTETHHGKVGAFCKLKAYAHQSEWRILLPPSGQETFYFELGQGLEDISAIVATADINSELILRAG